MLYIGTAALAPVLMAERHETAASIIYKGFHFLCHQYPWRSFFLNGEQLYYPLIVPDGKEMKSFDEASGMQYRMVDPRMFYGTPEMGYKMAVCQRDTAIYPAMALCCVIFFLSGNRMRKIGWKIWILLGIVPIGLDGFSQLLTHALPAVFPLRESTPFLRVLTGACFGYLTCRFLLPLLEQSLQEGDENTAVSS